MYVHIINYIAPFVSVGSVFAFPFLYVLVSVAPSCWKF